MKSNLTRALLALALCAGMTVALAACTEDDPKETTPETGADTSTQESVGDTEAETEAETKDPSTDYDVMVDYSFINNYTAAKATGTDLFKKTVRIAPTYKGLPVTEIGAFTGCDSVTNLVIPEGVLTVTGPLPANLTEITLPTTMTYLADVSAISSAITVENGVGYIGNWAVSCDKAATTVTLKDGTVGAAVGTFAGCTELTTVNFPSSFKYLCSSFEGCAKLTAAVIPEGTTFLADKAFSGCAALTSITIPATVTSIGNEAFSGCTGLTAITIPEAVTNIGKDAFAGCDALMTADGVVSYIGNWAVKADAIADKIAIKEGTVGIAGGTIKDNEALVEVTLPASLKYIGSYAITNCANKNFKTITIPEGVTELNANIFDGCKKLATVNLPASLKVIHANALFNTGVSKITIPTGIEQIEPYAFQTNKRTLAVTYDGTPNQWYNVNKDAGWNAGTYDINGKTGDIVITLKFTGEAVDNGFVAREDVAGNKGSFDDFQVSDIPYFDQSGSISTLLAKNDVVLSNEDGRDTTALLGWFGCEQAIKGFGYYIDDPTKIVYGEFAKTTGDDVKNAGGEFAQRFTIKADTSTLAPGKHRIGYVIQLADDTVVLLLDEISVIVLNDTPAAE